MNLLSGSRHLGDDDLIRYMDHQFDREVQRRMATHLRTCAECAERFDEVQKRSASVSRWLGDLAVEMPDPNKRAVALAAVERARFRRSATAPLSASWIRAAAGVVLLLSAVFGTVPGRAFVAHAVVRIYGGDPAPIATRFIEWLGQEEQLKPAVPASLPAVPAIPAEPKASGEESGGVGPLGARTEAAGSRLPPGSAPPVRFAPAGPDVELIFNSIQGGGSATLWFRDVVGANGQITSGLKGERLVPITDGLQVINRPDSRADYVITIPTHFRFVRVRVDDAPEVLIPISKSKREWIWTINLRTSALE